MLGRLLRRERGAVMAVAALTLTVLLLFAGLALDFGRAHLLKAQLQTAVDASALAGALQVRDMVELEIERLELVEWWCTDPVTKTNYRCDSWDPATPVRVEGTKSALIRGDGWRRQVASRCTGSYMCPGDYRIVRSWLELPRDTGAVAEDAFLRNATWPGGTLGATVEDVQVRIDQDKTEVTTSATMTVPTSFLKLVGIDYLKFTRTGSAVPVRL